MRLQVLFIMFLLVLTACEKRLVTDVPVEEILKGPHITQSEPKSEQVPVVEKPLNVTPVVEPKVVEEKTPEKGEITNIDVLLRSKSSTVNVMFEHGEEKFNLDNTDKDLIIGILVGKYNMTEQKIRGLTTFLQEAGTEQPVVNTSTSQQTVTASKVIEIKGYAFVPEVLTITRGTAVVWTHKDLAPHTVTSSGTESFDSGEMKRDDTFTHNFFTLGTYDYYCTHHPSMRGKIVVQ